MTAIQPLHAGAKIEGATDSGQYFHYMAEFVGFDEDDVETIKQTRPIIEKHLPDIINRFYAHLMAYPPTRKFFLKTDGSIDEPYLELRMRHQANFWLRTCEGVFDDEYATYLDYVGRAHTSRGADPRIYIAERYVIGQVGYMSHAIALAITQELRHVDEDFETRALEAWNKLMMVILELLARAYGTEKDSEEYLALAQVDTAEVERLAHEAYRLEHDKDKDVPRHPVVVADISEFGSESSRKIVQVEGLSIGLFHHNGHWHALRNSCLHRGGPVCTGPLNGDIITCPWHGFQYNLMDGHLITDPSARLDTYPVHVEDDKVILMMPDQQAQQAAYASQPAPAASAPVGTGAKSAPSTPPPAPTPAAAPAVPAKLAANEFRVADIAPDNIGVVQVDGEDVAVYNCAGTFYATSTTCTHADGPLDEGDLQDCIVTCPWHGSRFDVRDGHVVEGPAKTPVQTYKVTITDGVGHVDNP
ncbi:MAG: Rieske 2Fe-2S domain-containing protein [Anaerolineae bacterium]